MATAPSAPFVPGGTAADPSSLVELTISCRKLGNLDVLSKSDPMCVVYNKPFGHNKWIEMMRTETIMNTLDPDFTKKLSMTYHFEEQQPLKFDIYDVDSKSHRLDDHDYLGTAECTLGEIVANSCFRKRLSGRTVSGAASGEIILYVEELVACKSDARMKFIGKSLDKKDFFGKSDPFLVFYKSTESGAWVVCHKTEVIKNTLNPEWQLLEVPVRSLCNADYDRNIKVECYDWNRSGSHEIIGEFYTTINQLLRGPGSDNIYVLQNPKSKKKEKSCGEIHLIEFMIIPRYSFIDYVKGGTDLQCTIAVDFTASNGNPQTPQSLHCLFASGGNQYEQALSAVGQIIQDYDSDKMFPVLGFGARLPPDGKVSHEFFVNLNAENPYCHGIPGVLQAYRNCLNQIQLYGPTNFAPVINHVARFATAHRLGTHYFILLILTDGVITDMPQTKEAIISASSLPLSIIIIGVGNAEFDAMEELDGDAVRVNIHGKRAERDIVQFVPFRNFLQGGNDSTARIRLAKEVLAEIPAQFLGYMKVNGIIPNPPKYDLSNLPPDPEIAAH